MASDPDGSDAAGRLLAEAGRLRAAGEDATAAALLAEALARNPEVPPALYEALAGCLVVLGQSARAADVLNELAVRHLRSRQFGAALALCDRILATRPDHPAARANRGAALAGMGRAAEAVAWLTALVHDRPSADAYNELGAALLAAGRIEAAIAALRRALALIPDHTPALNNLALALQAEAPAPPAVPAIANPAEPDDLAASGEFAAEGQANARAGRVEQAISCYRRALARDPDSALVHWNLALALLSMGEFREGWREYEWRWRWPGFGHPDRGFTRPVWRGEPPDRLGGPLLVTMEQGFGDTIQFARYVPLLVARGHRVIFEVAPELAGLFRFSFRHRAVTVIARQADPRRVEGDPDFAAHVSLMSLPERFGTVLETIPAELPYIEAEPARIERWRTRSGPGFRVGLAWAGRPEHAEDARRSIPPAALAPLLALGLSNAVPLGFVSLQKSAAGDPALAGIAPLGAELADFADTAALIQCLDLVIAVDTAVAHLAGALGRPCWVMLPRPAEWRWLGQGDRSPWYPSMRLVRQGRPGDWAGVVAQVADDLARGIGARIGPTR